MHYITDDPAWVLPGTRVRAPAEVLYFVRKPEEAARWYATLFHAAVIRDAGPRRLRLGDAELSFHPAGGRGPIGPGGHVTYWETDGFDGLVNDALAGGAALYRGPVARLDGRPMCQLRDPFGNIFGLLGAAHAAG